MRTSTRTTDRFAPVIETASIETASIETTSIATAVPTAERALAFPVEVPDHALLVKANLMRYRASAPEAVTLGEVRPIATGEADAQERDERLVGRYFFGFISALFGGGLGLVPLCASTTSNATDLGAVGVVAAVGAALCGQAFRLEHRIHARKVARNATVPSGVAEAYRRIMSAAAEIEAAHELDTHRHDPDTRAPSADIIASARLAAASAPAMVSLVADHHAAGTFHAPAAQTLAGEMYRLAAEMDALMTVRNADRFASAEDDMLALVSTTTTLSFDSQP